MNKELKGRVFNLPQNILDKINHMIIGLNGQHMDGLNRAKKLLSDKTVNYVNLKGLYMTLKILIKLMTELNMIFVVVN